MKNIGIVRVNPSDYVIRLRNGKIHSQGLGMNFFTIPSEQYVIIPTTVSKIHFLADQISKENQGVEVSGFAFWKVNVPEKTYLHFDFAGKKDPIDTIDIFLKDVVESAIRHQVANMTIEEVLRKRGTIILQLKKELEYISNEWGIAIETIEIKNVKIMSEQLFHNMQAKYRDQVRLESETSALKTNQEIAEHQIKHKEEIALLEQEAKRKNLERKHEIENLELEKQSALILRKAEESNKQSLLQKENELTLYQKEEENRRIKIASEIETTEKEKEIMMRRIEIQRIENEANAHIANIELATEEERIRILNTENHVHLLIKQLHQIVSELQINELNIGKTEIAQVVSEIKSYLTQKA
jgi:regulator of protease activity HflC (stomatin/prohibitin superfamily)